MSGLRYLSRRGPSNVQSRFASTSRPTYRRLENRLRTFSVPSLTLSPLRSEVLHVRSQFQPDDVQIHFTRFGVARSFHQGLQAAQQSKADVKDSTPEEPLASKIEEEASEKDKSEQETASEEGEKGDKEESEGKEEKEKKENAPPPPPHGDKSPWQVFTETLQSEFKASKEWNESTKALASSAHQFTESESVKRARQAYEASAGAISSTTAQALKSTAGAVGKGAAWTWETPVVKGVRSTVNATASVIEKGTRPIRETEAFKNVKNVIDDGSSSRYGGWVEKEERRKKRELRELEKAAMAGRDGKSAEILKEDPK